MFPNLPLIYLIFFFSNKLNEWTSITHTHDTQSWTSFFWPKEYVHVCILICFTPQVAHALKQYHANTCQKQKHRIFPCSIKAEEFQLVYITFLIQSVWSKAPIKLDFEYFWGFCNCELLQLIERLFLPKPLAKNIPAHLRVRMIILATMPHV